MRCEEAMQTELLTVSPQDTLQRAAVRMNEGNVGFLPVLDGQRRPVGVVTDRDLVVRGIAQGCSLDTAVEQVMSRSVITCAPDDNLEDALRLMADNQIGRLVVADDDGRLLGVLSLADLALEADQSDAVEALRRVAERESRVLE